MLELLLTAPSLSILSQLDWQIDEVCTTEPQIHPGAKSHYLEQNNKQQLRSDQTTVNPSFMFTPWQWKRTLKGSLGSRFLKTMLKDALIFQLFKFTLPVNAFCHPSWNPHWWATTELNFFLAFFLCVASFGWTMVFKRQTLLCGRRNFFQRRIKETSGPSEGIALCLAATLLILKVNHYTLYLPVALSLLS